MIMNPSNTQEASSGVTPDTRMKLRQLCKPAEARHLTDEEMALIQDEVPETAPLITVARKIREMDVQIIKRVIEEVFSQYPYDKHHEFANPKCTRDVRYVVAYCCHAMICKDPVWLEDKLLIWLKTILQAFDFPDRQKSAANALFADKTMEKQIAGLPIKTKSIFQCYYRLRQEFQKALPPEDFEKIGPYLQQAVDVLSEKY